MSVKDAVNDQVADDDAHRRAHERVDAATVPAGRTLRRRCRAEEVVSRMTSQTKSASDRVTLNPLAKKAR
jgi:hypothetical protein